MAGGELLGSVFEYLNLLFLLDANALFFAARELEAQGPGLLRVLAAVGEVDAAMSTASVRAGAGAGGWTHPALGEPGSAAFLAGIRHPLLADAVPNTIALGPPHGVLVTGSNMSGKSTFLRTVGVTTVMAQTLNTCFADASRAPVYPVRTCIGRSDDLQAGKSYYIAEVEAVLGLVRASEEAAPHLFLFDELFRGTNAIERIAAGEAVLTQLLQPGATGSPHVVIAATHNGELVDLLRERYASFHFTDRMEPEGLVFDYTLKAGPATTRNANRAPATVRRSRVARRARHGASRAPHIRACGSRAQVERAARGVVRPIARAGRRAAGRRTARAQRQDRCPDRRAWPRRASRQRPVPF